MLPQIWVYHGSSSTGLGYMGAVCQYMFFLGHFYGIRTANMLNTMLNIISHKATKLLC